MPATLIHYELVMNVVVNLYTISHDAVGINLFRCLAACHLHSGCGGVIHNQGSVSNKY